MTVSYTHLGTGIEAKAAVDSGVCVVAKNAGVVERLSLIHIFRKLELEGLVLMIPRKGAEVAKISERSLRDVLEVRRSLEELAIELACQRMSEEDMDELERVQGSFRNAIARGEAMAIAETDEHYHDVIYQGTGNDKLVQMLNNLREQMYSCLLYTSRCV